MEATKIYLENVEATMESFFMNFKKPALELSKLKKWKFLPFFNAA